MEAELIRFPRNKLEREIKGVYQTLPYDTLEDGARKLSKYMGYKVTPVNLGLILTQIRIIARKDPDYITFTVPHARKGMRTNFEEGPRFVMVMVTSKDEPYFDEANKQQVLAGGRGCVAHATSSLANEAYAIKLALPYIDDPLTQKRVRSWGRRMGQLAEEGEELLEMIGDLNGFSK